MEKWRQLAKEAYALINGWTLKFKTTYMVECIKHNTKQNWDILLLLTNDKSFHCDSNGWVHIFGITLWGNTQVLSKHTFLSSHLQPSTKRKHSSSTRYTTQNYSSNPHAQNTHTHTHTHTCAHFSEYGTYWLLVTHTQWSDFPMHHHFQGQSCSCEVRTVFMMAHGHRQTSLITNKHTNPALMDGRFKHSISLTNMFCNLI